MGKYGIYIFLVLAITSCRVISPNYIIRNSLGREQLREMVLKKTFIKSMAEAVNTDSVYMNYYEERASSYKRYSYLKLYKTGQFALFVSKENDVNLNNLQSARFVGYYNVKSKVLYVEIPNITLTQGGKRIIQEYNILDNGNLQRVENKRVNNDIFQIKTPVNLFNVTPDW
jgi:hypothetical protein